MVEPNTDEIVALAELCIRHGLYKDARNHIENIVTRKSLSKTRLKAAEANMLIDCWKKESRPLLSFMNIPKDDANVNLKNFSTKVARDVQQLADAYVKLIDRCLLLNNSEYNANEFKYFKGCLLKVSTSVAPENENSDLFEKSLQNLVEANDWASQNLGPLHKTRLRMGLTLSQLYLMRNDEAKAIDVASKAYNEFINARQGQEQLLLPASLSSLLELKEILDSRGKQ